MKKLFTFFLALAVSLPAFAGGYPWGFQEKLTSQDLNAAFAARATFSCGTLTKYDTLIGNGGTDGGDICPVSPGTLNQIYTSNGPNAAPSFKTWNALTSSVYGTSVNDPGTGKLEASFPVQTITGFSHPFSTPDFFQKTRRSNAGFSMSDTLPAPTVSGIHNGTTINIANVDSVGAITITAAIGTTISGGATYTLQPGRDVTWSYDSNSSMWRALNNTTTSLTFTIGSEPTSSQLISGGAFPGTTSPVTVGNCLTLSSGTLAYTNGCGVSAVTSVGLSLPSFISVSGSPVTSTGTLTGTLISQTANTFFAAPNGSSGTPTFRGIVAADLPTATSSAKGIVQTDASTISNSSGTISCTTATSGQLGCSKPDNSTITASSGVYACTTATTSQLGCVKPDGSTITISGGILTAPATAQILRGYISGFTASNDGTSPNTVIDIAAGYGADSTNTVMITGTAFTKSISGTFTAGSGNNGMGTGLTASASTWYHIYAIICSGSYDVYFDTSATAANKPACASSFRYIGDILTNGSTQILGFAQHGQKITFTLPISALSGATSTTEAAFNVAVPPGFEYFPLTWIQTTGGTVGGSCNFYSGTSTNSDIQIYVQATTSNMVSYYQGTTSTQQMSYKANSSASCYMTLMGYINPHIAAVY